MFLDDTACNLASLNLMLFRHTRAEGAQASEARSGPAGPGDKRFDVAAIEHACRLWTIALEISVLMAQFPSKKIAELSYRYRTLGLGFANIGAC
jgi:ribonucleoside-diphosphate reductase alpha chain